MQRRNRNLQTPLAKRMKRLGLTVEKAQQITRAPAGNLRRWRRGQSRTPRSILRMLAAWRLLHWGQF